MRPGLSHENSDQGLFQGKLEKAAIETYFKKGGRETGGSAGLSEPGEEKKKRGAFLALSKQRGKEAIKSRNELVWAKDQGRGGEGKRPTIA